MAEEAAVVIEPTEPIVPPTDPPVDPPADPPPEFGSFYTNMSDEFKADPSAEKFKNADSDTMFKAYTDLQSLVGKDKIVRPNMEDPADVERWNRDIGVPETPDDYKLDAPPDWAAEAGYDQGIVKSILHKAGLTPEQVKIVESEYLKDIQATNERFEREQTEANGERSQELRQKLGAKYDESMTKNDQLIDKFADTPEAAQQIKDLVKANPVLASMFVNNTSVLSEHSLGGFEPTAQLVSAEDAQSQINAIVADPNHAYNRDDNGAAHDAAIDQVNRLQAYVNKGRKS